MPGIAGFISTAVPPDEGEALLHQMARCMSHESFYKSGCYSASSVGLGIAWAVHGEGADGLPIWNEKRDVCLVFSGEDFTDPREIENLRSRGHSFDPAGPGYLVHLYEESGTEFLKDLNGRFHGVIVDLRKPCAILFNDRYGLNRLYYHEHKTGFFFSAEAKALLRILPELRRLDSQGLAESFVCGCALQGRTLFPGISLIPGGAAWTFAMGRPPRRDFYFSPESWEKQPPLEDNEYYPLFKETWARILPRYLRGREKIAVSLTGGKDSRMMMAWLDSPAGTLPCYTFGGPYRECRDVKLAREVARLCHQPHQVIGVGKPFLDEFPGLAERTVYLTDGAMDVSGAPDLYVNRIARQIAAVRLTGNYGQEMLRSAVAFKPEMPKGPALNGDFIKTMMGVPQTYQHETTGHPLSFAAFKQLPWYHTCRLGVELSQLALRTPYLDKDLVALAYRAPRNTGTSVEMQMRLIAEGRPELGKLESDRGVLNDPRPVFTGLGHLWQEFTFKAEYAYDYGMPQWMASIDHALKPLRLERFFLGRHKFYHFRLWYREELSSYVQEILLDERALSRPYVDRQGLRRTVKDHIEGRRNYTPMLHRLLTAELLQRQLID